MIAWQHFTKTLHVGRKSCLRMVAAWAEQPQGTAQYLTPHSLVQEKGRELPHESDCNII